MQQRVYTMLCAEVTCLKVDESRSIFVPLLLCPVVIQKINSAFLASTSVTTYREIRHVQYSNCCEL